MRGRDVSLKNRRVGIDIVTARDRNEAGAGVHADMLVSITGHVPCKDEMAVIWYMISKERALDVEMNKLRRTPRLA